MDTAPGDDEYSLFDETLSEEDWLILDKNWWFTPISAFSPALSLFLNLEPTLPEDDDDSLDPLPSDLPGVRFAQQVLRFYESQVGIDSSLPSPIPAPFSLAGPALPLTDLNPEELDRANKNTWSDLAAVLEEDDDLVSPSMSSSVTTQRSTSVDLTSDSGRSAAYSSLPSTPKATESHIPIKDAASPFHTSPFDPPIPFPISAPDPPPSPILSFKFPSLDNPMVEITRDEDGFIVPSSDAKHAQDQTDSLLPPFLLQSAPKSKSASRSKTRSIVDMLRSSSRDSADDSCDDSSHPSVHDLSFIKPRLGASPESEDGDGVDGGWIGSPLNTTNSTGTSTSDSLMARANRARTLFLKKTKALAPSAKGKSKAKALDEPPPAKPSSSSVTASAPSLVQDKDGWIEYPSLNSNKAKLSSTKDTLHQHCPPRSKKASAPVQGMVNHHRRVVSQHPIPVSQYGPPSTSGTFVFPPRPPMPPPQWNGAPMPMPQAHPPPLQMFPAGPGPFFHHHRAPSMPAPMLRPSGPGPWIVPGSAPVPAPPMGPPLQVFSQVHHRKPASHHIIA